MQIKDISFAQPEKNILFDEVLLYLAEHSEGEREVLRLWESPQVFVVLGLTGKLQEDVHLDRCQRDRIPVLRRSSGGGTVVQGPGCLNYSLILSKQKHPGINDLRKSYHYIIGKIITAFSPLNVHGVFMPISDIALQETQKKFSGNAQKRGRNYILHHGTILYDFDLQFIERYLKIPRDVPEYRRDRGHLEFVGNIKLSSSQIKTALKGMYGHTLVTDKIEEEENVCLKKFLIEQGLRINAEKMI